MSDLFDKQRFLNDLINSSESIGRKSLMVMLEVLKNQPTIEAEPVVHGRWIHDINNLYGCSECMGRETMSHKRLKPYCPNCGAKMDGGTPNETD